MYYAPYTSRQRPYLDGVDPVLNRLGLVVPLGEQRQRECVQVLYAKSHRNRMEDRMKNRICKRVFNLPTGSPLGFDRSARGTGKSQKETRGVGGGGSFCISPQFFRARCFPKQRSGESLGQADRYSPLQSVADRSSRCPGRAPCGPPGRFQTLGAS